MDSSVHLSRFLGTQSIKQGWLVKRGGKRQTWKRRYFMLTSNFVFYFENIDSKIKGVVPLTLETSLHVSDNNTKQKEFSFEIRQVGYRSYFLVAQTEVEMNAWLESLGSVLQNLNNGNNSKETKQESGRTWEEEYKTEKKTRKTAEKNVKKLQEELARESSARQRMETLLSEKEAEVKANEKFMKATEQGLQAIRSQVDQEMESEREKRSEAEEAVVYMQGCMQQLHTENASLQKKNAKLLQEVELKATRIESLEREVYTMTKEVEEGRARLDLIMAAAGVEK